VLQNKSVAVIEETVAYEENEFEENNLREDEVVADESGLGNETSMEREQDVQRRRHEGKKKRMASRVGALTGVAPIGDAANLYLKEIGRIDLLNAAEEVDLAIKIEAGAEAEAKLIAAETSQIELTESEVRRLSRIEEIGIVAKQELVAANQRLVISNVRRYLGHGLTFLDLVQEGNIGLIHAAEKFDYTKGYKFSTYATWWIRQAMSRAISEKARTIRVPVHIAESLTKFNRVQRTLSQDLNREPTIEEIADAMKVSEDKIKELIQINREPISLETPIGEEDSVLSDLIEDENSVTPYEAASFGELCKDIRSVLSTLSDKEREVLELRYGFMDGRPHTLKEVGVKFGVTHERVRQIEKKALGRLRCPDMKAIALLV
jgi:RNA polymerase primary sigma factor